MVPSPWDSRLHCVPTMVITRKTKHRPAPGLSQNCNIVRQAFVLDSFLIK